MIDIYFRKPILIDYLIAVITAMVVYLLIFRGIITTPEYATLLSITTDLSTISLTFAGFILTLLTVFITFKMGAKVPESTDYKGISLFDLFFSTTLYTKTISLLKGCVVSLGVIAITGFSLKLFLNCTHAITLLLFNSSGLIIVALTFSRSLLILNKITNLQEDSDQRRRIENEED